MAVTFLTPSDITPGSATAWTDVDLSGTISANATGIIFHAEAPSSTALGWRKNGSTDARTDAVDADRHMWGCCGVDGSQILELYVGSTTNITVWLVGYFEDDAVFFDNATDKSSGAADTWTDVDISSDSGTDTAIAAILETKFDNNARLYAFRKNGSTDERYEEPRNPHLSAIIGVDGSEIYEQKRSTSGVEVFLNGYITKDATFNTNATDYSLSTTAAWTDLTALPTGATGGIIEYSQSSASPTDGGLRKNGSTEDIFRLLGQGWSYVESDGSRLIEGKITDTTLDFFLTGYFEAAAGGTTYTQSIAGSITPTGSVSDAITFAQLIAGSITGTGALTKKTKKALAGSITAAGALTKKTMKTVAGSITAVGSLAKKTTKSSAGSITPTGAISTQVVITTLITGSITAVGSLAKKTKKGLSGAITATGALTKKTAKQIGGTITAVGSIAKKTYKAFAGSITPTGSLSPKTILRHAVSGVITMAGAVATTITTWVTTVSDVITGFRRRKRRK